MPYWKFNKKQKKIKEGKTIKVYNMTRVKVKQYD